MKKDQHHINVYTAADFARYHSGEMNEQEMHALELAALNDPFLAEALEGYAFTPAAEDDVTFLRQQIQGKDGNEKKAIVVKSGFKYWMSAAAAVVMVAVAAYFVMKSENEDGKPAGTSLAKNQTLRAADDAPSVSSAPLAAEEMNVRTDTVYKTPIPNGNQAASGYHTSPIPGVQNPLTESVRDIATNQQPTTEVKEEVTTDNMKGYYAEEKLLMKDSDAKPGSVITGTVTNEEGEPVPYATVSNAQNQVLSDEKGKFKLPVKDSMVFASVKATGYDPTMMYNVSPRQENNIVLRKNTQVLTETVITAAPTRSKKSAELLASKQKVSAKELQSVNNMPAQPVDGWTAYQSYLSTAKKPVLNEKGLPVSGQVILSFKVNSSGKATKIRVEQSLCKACDAEAIRLVQEGPLWKASGGKRVRANIQF